MAELPIPIDVEDLDAAWFSQILRPHAPGVQVTSVEVLAAHSGTTGRVKLQLGYKDGGGLPETLFCKIAPFDPRQRDFLRQVGIGVMEARLYASLAAELPVRIPRMWHAETDDDGGFIMVLEDLDASGCTFPRPADADVDDRALGTVQELALLHAQYWESPRFAEDLSWVPDRAGFGAGGSKDPAAVAMAGRFMSLALDRFSDDMPSVFRAVATLYADRAGEILDLWDEGQRTLIHGDPHAGNLFTDHGRTGFFDWAMFSRSPGMRDVAYYCCNSLPTDVRRAIQSDLVEEYRRALADHNVGLDSELAESQLRLFAVFSWVSTACTAAMGDRWQPADRAVAAMRRTTTAVDDLDSVGLLLELL